MRFFYATSSGGSGGSGGNISGNTGDTSGDHHDGNGNGEDEQKRSFFSRYKWIFAIVFIVWLIGKCQDDDPPSVPQDTQTKSEQGAKQQAQNKREFSFTVQEFVRRYNQASQNVADGGLIPKRVFIDEKRELSDAMEYRLAHTTNEDHIYFSVATNKNRDAVRAVFYMIYLSPDTNAMSMMGDMLYGFAATIMAVENPHMPPSERGQRLKEIGVFKVMEEKRAILSRKNNVDYKIDIVEAMGAITLSIKPTSP